MAQLGEELCLASGCRLKLTPGHPHLLNRYTAQNVVLSAHFCGGEQWDR